MSELHTTNWTHFHLQYSQIGIITGDVQQQRHRKSSNKANHRFVRNGCCHQKGTSSSGHPTIGWLHRLVIFLSGFAREAILQELGRCWTGTEQCYINLIVHFQFQCFKITLKCEEKMWIKSHRKHENNVWRNGLHAKHAWPLCMMPNSVQQLDLNYSM